MIRKSAWLLSAALVAVPNAGIRQTATTTPTPQADRRPRRPSRPRSTQARRAGSSRRRHRRHRHHRQGRRQVLQDVPIAVTAVGGERLQNSGATDIRQLNQLAPSLLVSSTGTEANGSARIRGIGTVGDNPGLESSVAVFIDGVYRSRTGIGLNELGEIDRVEVLRGPQGTLFGRNASAGLIHIITSEADVHARRLRRSRRYGNYDCSRAARRRHRPAHRARIAARLDGVYVEARRLLRRRQPDRRNRNDVNDRDRFFTRGQLLFQPNDKLSFRLIGDYHQRDETAAARSMSDRANLRSDTGRAGRLRDGAEQPHRQRIVKSARPRRHPPSQRRPLQPQHLDHAGPRLTRARPRTGACRARSTTTSAARS